MFKKKTQDHVLNEVIEMTEGHEGTANWKNVDFTQPPELQRKSHYTQHLPSSNIGSSFGSLSRNGTSDTSEQTETTALLEPFSTLRFPRAPPLAMEDQAAAIVSHFEQKDKLMQDHPESELLRLEMLRNMPQYLTIKRSVKAKLTLSVSQKSQKRPIGYGKQLKYRISIAISMAINTIRNISLSMELWYHPIKTIEGHFGSGIAAYFKFLQWLFLVNVIGCIFSISFIVVPQAFISTHTTNEFGAWDLLLGNGFFTNSIMYYGFYSNETLVTRGNVVYDMPSAYFITFLVCYSITLLLLCFKVVRSYRKSYIETSSGVYNRYAIKIFCDWDWGISSHHTANLRSASIYRELQELLLEAKNTSNENSFSTRCLTFLIRASMSTLVMALMCGTGAILWILLSEHETNEKNVWSALIVPVVLTCIIELFPPLISWSVQFEKYTKDRTGFYVTMIRIYTMAAVAVATLLTFWLTRGTRSGCWQTRLSQEIYRLVLLDFIVSVVGISILQMVRSKFLQETVGPATFNVAQNTLNLIYNQSLFSAVYFFSPPLSLVVLLKFFLTFYIKKCELLGFCEPPAKSWRAAQTQTLFLALTFLGVISAVLFLSYVVVYAETGNCGPFSERDFVWQVVVDRVFGVNRDGTLWNILCEAVRSGAGYLLLVTMGIMIYYLRAKAEASKQMVAILREMLIWQARDKEFLLKSFTKVTDDNWARRRRPITNPMQAGDFAKSQPVTHEPSTSY